MSDQTLPLQGWKIERVGDRIAVTHPDLGGYAAKFNPDSIAETTLHRLAESLLEENRYAELEREHFGDPEKKTGIYAVRDTPTSPVRKLTFNEALARLLKDEFEEYEGPVIVPPVTVEHSNTPLADTGDFIGHTWIEDANKTLIAEWTDASDIDEVRIAELAARLNIVAPVAETLDTVPHAIRQDAMRWRALFECSRIRVLGYARGGPEGRDGAIRHIGFEWTTDQAPYCDTELLDGKERLIEFTDAILGASKDGTAA